MPLIIRIAIVAAKCGSLFLKGASMRLLAAAALMFASCAAMLGQQPGELTPLKVGDEAPNFTLGSTAGAKVTLADFKGKNPVVLAFFPAAFTGG
jgi:cytochrome oxidase Cu insertion factor (SCO1/SenC/PrrC family)